MELANGDPGGGMEDARDICRCQSECIAHPLATAFQFMSDGFGPDGQWGPGNGWCACLQLANGGASFEQNVASGMHLHQTLHGCALCDIAHIQGWQDVQRCQIGGQTPTCQANTCHNDGECKQPALHHSVCSWLVSYSPAGEHRGGGCAPSSYRPVRLRPAVRGASVGHRLSVQRRRVLRMPDDHGHELCNATCKSSVRLLRSSCCCLFGSRSSKRLTFWRGAKDSPDAHALHALHDRAHGRRCRAACMLRRRPAERRPGERALKAFLSAQSESDDCPSRPAHAWLLAVLSRRALSHLDPSRRADSLALNSDRDSFLRSLLLCEI